MVDTDIERIDGTLTVPEHAISPVRNGVYSLKLTNGDVTSIFGLPTAPPIRPGLTKLNLITTIPGMTRNVSSSHSTITVQKVHMYQIHYPENSSSMSQLVDLSIEFTYSHLKDVKDQLDIQIGKIIQNNKTLAVEFFMGVSDKNTAGALVQDRYPTIYHLGGQYKFNRAMALTARLDSEENGMPVRKELITAVIGLYHSRELPNTKEENELFGLFQRVYNV